MPNASTDDAMRVLAAEVFRIRTAIRVGCAIGISFKRNGGHRDRRGAGEALFKLVVLSLALRQAEPPAVIVDDDPDMIGVVEGNCATLERGIVEIPPWGRQLPNEPGESPSIFLIARAAAFGGKMILVPPLEFGRCGRGMLPDSWLPMR